MNLTEIQEKYEEREDKRLTIFTEAEERRLAYAEEEKKRHEAE